MTFWIDKNGRTRFGRKMDARDSAAAAVFAFLLLIFGIGVLVGAVLL